MILIDILLVPILDVRKEKIELPGSIKDITRIYPRFSGGVPQDSVVLVCYTLSKFEKNNAVNASLNLMWAAVLCGNDA